METAAGAASIGTTSGARRTLYAKAGPGVECRLPVRVGDREQKAEVRGRQRDESGLVMRVIGMMMIGDFRTLAADIGIVMRMSAIFVRVKITGDDGRKLMKTGRMRRLCH
ncbi:hypothetical protein CO648_09880 [Rhizobium phaseoli]|nr:hypothetical protein CO648_09880 [Rhizobium phaseoli]